MNGIHQARNKMRVPHSRQAGNGVLRHFRPAHTAPAASNRALRREWATVANATLRPTGDLEAPQRAGSEMLAVALDLVAGTTEPGTRDRKGRPPGFTSLISLPAAVSRSASGGGDLSRAIVAIFAGAAP
jgi:hypothetical protein